MTRLYECMFVIDNDAVRTGWNDVKKNVVALVEKHGGRVRTARRWGERRLTYPMRHKNRGTFLLTYLDLAPEHTAELRRDLDISEYCLRYLILAAEEVPAEEVELSASEESADFVLPEPPPDDHDDEAEAAAQRAAEAAAQRAAEEAEAAKAEAEKDSSEATPAAEGETVPTGAATPENTEA